MRPAASMHVQGFQTGAFDTANQTRQLSGILAVLSLPFAGVCLPLSLEARPTLFFC